MLFDTDHSISTSNDKVKTALLLCQNYLLYMKRQTTKTVNSVILIP